MFIHIIARITSVWIGSVHILHCTRQEKVFNKTDKFDMCAVKSIHLETNFASFAVGN